MPLWTYRDAIDRALDVVADVGDVDRYQRLARDAVNDAYRDVFGVEDWPFLMKRYSFVTEAKYSTGTIQYDHTGGAGGEYEVTLTGGTWPTNADLGTLKINQDYYAVKQRVSNTVVLLSEDENLGSDITTATTYEWFREHYQMPRTMRRADRLHVAKDNDVLTEISPNEALTSTRLYGAATTTQPRAFTLRNDNRRSNSWGIVLVPPPGDAKRYEFVGAFEGNPLEVEEYSTGTATNTAGSRTVTFSGATITAQMTGAVLRLSTDATAPTSVRGGLSTFSPADEEAVIHRVVSATEVETEDAVVRAHTAGAYTISSRLDIGVDQMLTVFWRKLELEMARMFNHSKAAIDRRERSYMLALDDAREFSRLSRAIRSAMPDPDSFSPRFTLGTVNVNP